MTAPADLCEKKRQAREIRRLRRKLGWIDIPVAYDRTDLTGLGHLPLFVNFARVMGLEESVDKRLHLRRRERSDGFTATQMLSRARRGYRVRDRPGGQHLAARDRRPPAVAP